MKSLSTTKFSLYFLALFFASQVEAKTLRMSLPAPPVSLDWTGQVNLSDAAIVVNICEGLFSFQYPAEKLVPALAESLKKSKDLTEYTFQIRKDAKWSDGRPVYAKDFVDAWQKLISPQATSIYSYYLFDLVNAKEFHDQKITDFNKVGIKATADKTLVIKFKHPQPQWEANTTFWPLFPVRKDLIDKHGNNWWHAGTLVSTGPYIFHSYEPGKKAILKKNTYYRKTLSNVDEIEVNFITDQEQAMKRFQKKEFLFLGGIPIEDYHQSKEFRSISLLRHHVFVFNTERFPFNNLNFRLAVLSSIDRSKLLPKKYSKLSLASGLIPSSLSGSKEEFVVPFNVSKAKEYLEKSGIVLSKDYKINLLVGFQEPFYGIAKKMAEQIQSTLKITTEVLSFKNQDFETFSNLGEYGAVMISWTAKVRSPQDFLLPYSGYANANNRAHFNNENYDQAIAIDDFKKAQTIIIKEQAVVAPLFFEKSGFLVQPNILNIYFDHRGLPVLRDIRF